MIPPLLMDLYELTMAAGYLRRDMHERTGVFDLYFRRLPFGSGYAVFAGLEPALDYLEGLRFGEREIRYLGGLGLFEDRFLDYLRSFRFSGRVAAPAEGEVVFANEPLLTVEGPLAEAQIVETALLNLVDFQTLIATRAARIVGEAGEGTVVEFGARRAHGPDGALGASRAACIGGARITSHLEAGRVFDLPVAGTQAHSWVMAFPTEAEAFRAYAETFPDRCVLLVDTYDTLGTGLPNAIETARWLRARGHALQGIRLDSGDLAYLSREARRLLDEAGFSEVQIMASNELDEHVIESVRKDGGRVDVYGVGTRLVTGSGRDGGALGGVYKLVEYDGRPRVKISSDRAKSTIGGRKRVWRLCDREGRFEMDVVARPDETPRAGDPVFDPTNPLRRLRLREGARFEDLRTVVMEGGRRTRAAPALADLADHARGRLERLPKESRRLLNPHRYRVAVTQRLLDDRERLIEAALAACGPRREPAGRRPGSGE
jgi:nicotinate phosphoribosyltransferase